MGRAALWESNDPTSTIARCFSLYCGYWRSGTQPEYPIRPKSVAQPWLRIQLGIRGSTVCDRFTRLKEHRETFVCNIPGSYSNEAEAALLTEELKRTEATEPPMALMSAEAAESLRH